MSATSNGRVLLTAGDLASRWGFATNTIYSWAKTGQLPTLPLPGKAIRFTLEDIEKYERHEWKPNGSTGGTPSTGKSR